MKILENVSAVKKDGIDVILMISFKEAKVLNDAVEEYSNNNKRKKIAKKIYNQFCKELAY